MSVIFYIVHTWLENNSQVTTDYITNRLPIVSVNAGVFTVIVFTLCLFAAAISNAAYSSDDGDI